MFFSAPAFQAGADLRLKLGDSIGRLWLFASFLIILAMLSLKTATDQRWLDQVDNDLASVLIDHAHCEKKAAGTAMNLIVAYVENEQLCRDMTEIVNEELEHFHMVLDVLKQRDIKFCRLKPSSYGRRLHDHIRKQEPDRAVDRLLIAGLIEARSCERFSRLGDHVEDQSLGRFLPKPFRVGGAPSFDLCATRSRLRQRVESASAVRGAFGHRGGNYFHR